MTTSDRRGLAAEGLVVRRGGRRILDACSFAIGPGLHVLRGANGSGKSTLLKALAGILRRAAGTVSIAGADLDGEPVEARRRLGYAPETPDLFPYLTVRELLEVVAALRGASAASALDLVAALGLPDRAEDRLGALSLGQRRKVTLAAALAGDPAVLLLDEPLSGLDVAALAALRGRLVDAREAGRTLLVATHDLGPLAGIIDGVLFVEEGRIRAGDVASIDGGR